MRPNASTRHPYKHMLFHGMIAMLGLTITATALSAPPSVLARAIGIRLTDGTELSGELTRPAGIPLNRRLPLVILVHGSGANDMNETASAQDAGVPGGSAVFLQLARHLSANGLAVLRYNKRGVTGVGPRVLPASQRVGKAYTISGYAADAQAVLRYARTLPGIDSNRAFLLGHSEGTMIVAKLARQDPELFRGLVMIGTVGEPLRITLHGQAVEQPLKLYSEVFDQDHDGSISLQQVLAIAKQQHLEQELPFLGLVQTRSGWQFPAGVPDNAGEQVSIQNQLRPALERMFDHYPNLPLFSAQNRLYLRDAERFGTVTQNLPGYRGPVLMLQGQDDPNTRASGAQAAYSAVRKGGNTQITLRLYAGLGHSLAPSNQGIPTLGWVAPTPLQDLTRWLLTESDQRRSP